MNLTQFKKKHSLILPEATLCFLIKNNSICLAMKKRGFGVGKWNGVGGKSEFNESIIQTAIRETHEEISVHVDDIELFGKISFYHLNDTIPGLKVYIFIAKKWRGLPKETEEMKPKWFDFADIPYDNMWPDDRVWLPKLLNGDKFIGEFLFENSKILDYKINTISFIKI